MTFSILGKFRRSTVSLGSERRIKAGDHDIFIAEMVAARVNEGQPLIHFASGYRRLADAPLG